MTTSQFRYFQIDLYNPLYLEMLLISIGLSNCFFKVIEQTTTPLPLGHPVVPAPSRWDLPPPQIPTLHYSKAYMLPFVCNLLLLSLSSSDVESRGGKGGGSKPRENFIKYRILNLMRIPLTVKRGWLIVTNHKSSLILMELEYDDWQIDVINDTSQYILICKGRQIGGTSTLAEKAVKWMKEKKSKILVGSITEEQAKLVIVMVKNILYKNDRKLIATGKNKPTLDKVMLKGGGEIRSRPVGTMGDAFRGFTADINWFNEASKWPEIAFTSIMPTLMTTGGAIWMDSTPFGKFIGNTTKKTFFYKCWENLDKRWSIYYKTAEKVLKERKITAYWTIERKEASLNFLKDQKAILSDTEYKQEYLGKFMDDLRQWFSDKLIRERMVAKRPERIDPTWLVGMGNDIARKGIDAGSYEIFRVSGDRLIQIENQISHDQPITDTTDQIIGLNNKFFCDRIFIDDEGSLGKGVYDILLKDEITREKVIGISNSKRIIDRWGKEKGIKKEELYVKLLSMMEKGEIDLLDDENIFQSLKSVQYAYTNDSLGRRHLKIFGYDTHICEGITRATEILKYKDLNPIVYTIPI